MYILLPPDFGKNCEDDMGLPAKIPDPAPEELFREMIHDEIDKWVDVSAVP
ncbi:conserved hypothetical protein [delta proteobacterium NaphS2]|nr:conserved hypothetical protein [delta proteobacterium NaphS2]